MKIESKQWTCGCCTRIQISMLQQPQVHMLVNTPKGSAYLYSPPENVFGPGIQIFTAQKHFLRPLSQKEYLDHYRR